MLDWMQELLDLPAAFRSTSDTGGGVIQGTASEATLVAILSARWRATAGAVNHDGDTTQARRLRHLAGALEHREGTADRRHRHRPHPRGAPRRRLRDARRRARRDDRRRPRRGTRAVLRVLHPRHDLVDGVRSDRGDRRGVPPPRRVAARRRRDVRHRRARTRVPLGQRRAGVRRLVLHQPAQVDGRELRLRPLLDRRPRTRCSAHSASCRSTCARRPPRPAR